MVYYSRRVTYSQLYNEGARIVVLLPSGGNSWLYLQDTVAHTTIAASTSRTVLTQTFVNPTSLAYNESTYYFPLFDGVSVVDFKCTIGGRVIRGRVKESQQARKAFDDAKAKGEKAGLLTHTPSANDVFKTSLANIGPNEKAIVEVTFLGELKHDAQIDGLRFTLPVNIAPRYTSDYVLPYDKGAVTLGTGNINFTVDVETAPGASIKSVESPSHPVSVKIGTTSKTEHEDPSLQRASATFNRYDSVLDKDFIVQICATKLGDPSAVIETHPTIPNRKALMATLVPRFTLPVESPEVVFVCDRSGSMDQGKRIPNMVSALHIFLKSLPVDCKFNVCNFGSSYTTLFTKSQDYTAKTLEQAVQFINRGHGLGGTEMFTPIKAMIDNRDKERNLELIVLTDGEIWNQDVMFSMVRDAVKESGNTVRIFTLGIGNDASHALIEGLARNGQGFCQSVGEDEKMDRKLLRMLKAALMTHVTDYKLEIKYEKADDDEFELVEKVQDALVLDQELEAEEKPEPQPKPTMSLHDTSIDDGDLQMTDVQDETLPDVKIPTYLQTPHRIPSLFPFVRTTAYVLLSEDGPQREPKSVILKGTSKHGPLELEIPVSKLPEPSTTIHQLAARNAVLELEEERGWLYEPVGKAKLSAGRAEKLAKAAAIKLGVEYQVSNQSCSWVALEVHDDDEVAVAAEEEQAEEEELAKTYSPAGYMLLSGRPAPVARGGRFAFRKQAVSSVASSFGSARSREQMMPGLDALPQSPMMMPQCQQQAQATSGGLFGNPGFSALSQQQALAQQQTQALQQVQAQQQAQALQQAQTTSGGSFGNPGFAAQAGGGFSFGSNSARPTAGSIFSCSSTVSGAPPGSGLFGSSTVGSSESGLLGSFGSAPSPPPPAPASMAYKKSSNFGPDSMASGTTFGSPAPSGGLVSPPNRYGAFDSSLSQTRSETSPFGATNSSTAVPNNSSATEKLIFLQEFSGEWKWTDALQAVLGVDLATVKAKVAGADYIVATFAAVAFLRKRFAGDEDIWEFVVDKAETWLRSKVGADFEATLHAAESIF